MALQDIYNGLTDEQRAQARDCTSSAELAALAQSVGIELSLDELDEVAGGDFIDKLKNWDGQCNGLIS